MLKKGDTVVMNGFVVKRQKELEKKLKDAQTSSKGAISQVREIFSELNESVDALSSFSKGLNKNLSEAGVIAKQVTVSYAEITEGAELQKNNLHRIEQLTTTIEEEINDVSVLSENMRNASEKTLKIGDDGNKEIKQLIDEIESLSSIIKETVNSIHELNEENKEIRTHETAKVIRNV